MTPPFRIWLVNMPHIQTILYIKLHYLRKPYPKTYRHSRTIQSNLPSSIPSFLVYNDKNPVSSSTPCAIIFLTAGNPTNALIVRIGQLSFVAAEPKEISIRLGGMGGDS